VHWQQGWWCSLLGSSVISSGTPPRHSAEFETASKQAEVHWLLWLGALMVLAVTLLTLSRSPFPTRNRGYRLTFASTVLFAIVSVLHFIEHANGTDPELARIFLYGTSFAILAGATLTLIAGRRGEAPRPP
jgi:hypothetical protein